MNSPHFRISKFLIVFLLLGITSMCVAKKKAADLVLLHGKIVTMDEKGGEAEALAVKGDRILKVGSEDQIKQYVGPSTKVIDLEGKLAVPGFIDSHAHFLGLGKAKMQLDLRDVRNWEEIISIVAEAAGKAQVGEWITGSGWHQEKWDTIPKPNVEGYPTHEALSRETPDNPVLLTHASGHMVFANAKAMELAGVDADTRSPSGGTILKDNEGNPTGMFRESAAGLIHRAKSKSEAQRTPEQERAELLKQIELAQDECIAKGITTFHDAGSSFDEIDLLKTLAEEGKLKLRLWVMIGEENAQLKERLADYKLLGVDDNHLTVRAIKRFMDGALGTHGAWLLEPYSDLPDTAGLSVSSIESMKETARLAIENGFQLCTHAIGDRANREVLNVYEEAFRAHPDRTDLRWRIEHAQHLHPDDIPRFGKLGVIASMQACHCTSDAPFVLARLGEERAKSGAYVWRSLLDTGAVIANGTDAPVEDVSPIRCFYASVSRRLKDGSVFYPEQRMSRMKALRSYTINGAYTGFEEDIKGSLTPRKLADITVLSKDILTVPEEEILDTEVVYTIVGGKVVFCER